MPNTPLEPSRYCSRLSGKAVARKIMNDMQKYEYIMSGTQLLVVPSRIPPMSDSRKKFILACWYIGAAFLLFAGIYLAAKGKQPIILLMLGTVGATLTILLGHYGISFMAVRSNSLVVSECGIAIDHKNCATWEEIKSWSFRTYKGIERVVGLGVSGEGTTINIETGDFDSRFRGANRSSVDHFALRGIFLSDTQQEIWKRICEERNLDQPFGCFFVRRIKDEETTA